MSQLILPALPPRVNYYRVYFVPALPGLIVLSVVYRSEVFVFLKFFFYVFGFMVILFFCVSNVFSYIFICLSSYIGV